MIFYNYFNVIILHIHSIARGYKNLTHYELINNDSQNSIIYNINIPCCKARSNNYFSKKAIKISSFNEKVDNEVIQFIKNQVDASIYTVPLLIDESLGYPSTISKLFYDIPYKCFYYIKEVNKLFSNKQHINENGFSFSKVESQKALIINLSY